MFYTLNLIQQTYQCEANDTAKGYFDTDLSKLISEDFKLTVPCGITEIGEQIYKYENRDQIKTVEFLDTITKIGNFAFKQCQGLISITIPSSVTELGKEAFYDCATPQITKIQQATFKNCMNLRSIDIPQQITQIEEEAFMYSGLRAITFQSTMEQIGKRAFAGSERLSCVYSTKNSITISTGAFADTPYENKTYPGTDYNTTTCSAVYIQCSTVGDQDKYYVENIETQCIAKQYVDYFYLSQEKKMDVYSCEGDFKFVQSTETDPIQCYEKCTETKSYYTSENLPYTCIESCEEKYGFYIIEGDNTNLCSQKCKSNQFYKQSETKPIECLSSCPEKTYSLEDQTPSECVESCPEKYELKKDTTICAKQTGLKTPVLIGIVVAAVVVVVIIIVIIACACKKKNHKKSNDIEMNADSKQNKKDECLQQTKN